MSVHVTIEYRQPHPEIGAELPLTTRTLEIRRVDREGNHGDDRDTVYEYVVVNNRGRSAVFEHRFGDDMSVLIGKAGEAIRAKHTHF